jgi:Zn-dependent protease/CBS domain-containing protein
MFGRKIRLFRLLGFEVSIDLSWIFIVALITWSLARGVFPAMVRGLPAGTYWAMGIVGALGLFVSIVIHEFSHSIVARRSGIPMQGITLFIFGGVAEMSEEPPSAGKEFAMAVVGPLASVVIGVICLGIGAAGLRAGWPLPVTDVIRYLGSINLLLAVFNLIPAFPLDGGRVLRAILWRTKHDLHRATRIAAGIGSGFGIALVVLGVVAVFMGNFIGGMWWFLIGLFLRNAARMSYQQLVTRETLEGQPVRRFMTRDPVTVPPSLSVRDLVENYIYRLHYRIYPIVEDGRLLGCVGTQEVRSLPREEWDSTPVSRAAATCGVDNTIGPDDSAADALTKMNRTGATRLIVTEGDRLVGIISLKDLLRFLSLHMELEKSEAADRKSA